MSIVLPPEWLLRRIPGQEKKLKHYMILVEGYRILLRFSYEKFIGVL